MRNLFYILLIVFLSTCEKKDILIPGNTPYQGKYISTIQVENYVNKIFIDLIGREPLNTEMEAEVNLLKQNELSDEARKTLITKLQTSTTFLPGDSSYQKAYYHRFYDVVKIRMLEGIENDVMKERRGILTNAYNGAVASGDSLEASIKLKNITEINNILNIEEDYLNESINIEQIFQRLLDNYVYDEINMNTFNFVNASFDDLFFRMPTNEEYEIAYEMIENNNSGSLFGLNGTSKGEYLQILTQSREFYEGLIIWAYKSLLIRNPTATETIAQLTELINTKDYQALQLEIMITNEYANFE